MSGKSDIERTTPRSHNTHGLHVILYNCATTGSGGRSMKRPTGVRIHRRVEGEKHDVNTTATAIAEHTRIPRSKGAPIPMGMRQEMLQTRVESPEPRSRQTLTASELALVITANGMNTCLPAYSSSHEWPLPVDGYWHLRH
ncbi:hypothetical protein EAG_04883 [Camponotus floridanus]|uniref:Uncharacterized protein n=1 Tax=Camponotus floridanus TaxID=104421 RepID=E2ASZ3_CAMFO|nr:hypothetical protein EAG_04883 [Camponotus floridanus]